MTRLEIRVAASIAVLTLMVAGRAVGQSPPALDIPTATGESPSAFESAAEDNPTKVVESESKTDPDAKSPGDEEAADLPPLSEEMASLRDKVRRSLAQLYARPLNTRDHLPAEVIAFCEAFGHTAEIASSGGTSQRINGIGALCWNYPCGGYRLLRAEGGQIVASVGYGHQQRPGELLALLAATAVPATYELRVGETTATVGDLAESEKENCIEGADLSGVLAGLAFYTDDGEKWESRDGKAWTLTRILEAELNRKVDAGSIDTINHLMGLSFALAQIERRELSVDGDLLERTKKYVEKMHDFALELQNSDGSWHPGFLAYRGSSNDSAGVLLATGEILTWLVYSLPVDRLEDPRVVRSANYVYQQVGSRASSRYGMPTSTREVIGIMSGARALSLYDSRYFTPRTPEAPEPAEPAAAQAASTATQSRSTAASPSSSSNSGRSSYSPQSQPSSRYRRR